MRTDGFDRADDFVAEDRRRRLEALTEKGRQVAPAERAAENATRTLAPSGGAVDCGMNCSGCPAPVKIAARGVIAVLECPIFTTIDMVFRPVHETGT